MEKIRNKLENKGYLVLSLSIWLCCSCTNTDDKLLAYIENHCNFNSKDTCYINFEKVVNIDYDEMYIFGETTTKEEISEIIRLSYKNDNYISDSEYRMILIKNKQIVYEDDFYQDKVIFSEKSTLSDDKKNGNPTVFCIKNDSPKFRVIKMKKFTNEGCGFFYILEQQ
jgi:hypothetical protein